MCLIIIKPENIDFPNRNLLFKAFKNNPDGAGIAYNKHDNLYIHKGYMTFNHFIDFYDDIITKLNKNSTLVLHFRKVSRGKVNPDLTHPFPISDDINILTKTFIKTQYAVAHNGTIKEMDKYLKKNRQLSDTIIFIKEYLKLISENENWFYKECNKKLLEKMLEGQRMCILNNKGELMIFGQFFEYNGLLFSKQIF